MTPKQPQITIAGHHLTLHVEDGNRYQPTIPYGPSTGDGERKFCFSPRSWDDCRVAFIQTTDKNGREITRVRAEPGKIRSTCANMTGFVLNNGVVEAILTKTGKKSVTMRFQAIMDNQDGRYSWKVVQFDRTISIGDNLITEPTQEEMDKWENIRSTDCEWFPYGKPRRLCATNPNDEVVEPQGINKDAQNDLYDAIEADDPEAAKEAVKRGADPREPSLTGKPAYEIAALGTCRNGILGFLSSHGVDANQRNSDDETPLFAAAVGGQVRMVDFLLSHCADPLAKCGIGDTARTAAIAEMRSADEVNKSSIAMCIERLREAEIRAHKKAACALIDEQYSQAA